MRKSLMLTFLLFVLSVGILFGAYGMVNPRKDAVTVKETVLSGDRAAARGIAVTNRTSSTDHLRWDTVYALGDDLDVETGFTFSREGIGENYEPEPWTGLYTNLNYGISGNGINLEDDSMGKRLALAPVRDVAGRTPAGQTREETVDLNDYYEFYPLTLEMSGSSRSLRDSEDLQRDITDYFKIPVSEAHRVQVSVTKDSGGNLTTIECRSVSGETVLSTASAVTDSGCYLAITANDGDTGEPVPLPPGISGIHFIPVEEREGMTFPAVRDARLIYPLDSKTTQALRLLRSTGGRLLLFTREAGSIQLSVIEPETMELLQKTELTEGAAGLELWQVEQYDTFFVAIYSDGGFCVLTEEGDGGCEIRLTGNFYACEEIRDLPFWNMALDYDGNRLAAVFYQRQYGVSSTYLMVFNGEGLVYAGKYDQNSDRTPDVGGDTYSAGGVHPMNTKPLRVTCG